MLKRKNTYIFLLALTFGIFILIAGCSSNSQPSSKQDDSANQQAQSSDSTANSEEKYVFKVGHVAPPNHSYTLGLDEYAQLVSEATDGRVEFDIFGGGQLGGERDLTEQIQLGTLDMGLITSGPVGNFVPELSVLEMPFIFRDVDHVYKTLDGDVGEELLAKLEDAGFIGLGFWENGFRHLTNNKKEIRQPEDMTGLKMRTVENDIFVETYRALGSDPTPIAFPEVYTSFQQGVVDGFDASYGVFESTNMFEVQKYFSEAGIYYASAVLLINKDLFHSLPEDIQEVLFNTGREYASKQREINQQMEGEQRQTLLEHGVEIVQMSELDLEAFRTAVQPIYDNYGNRFGDYVERIQAVK